MRGMPPRPAPAASWLRLAVLLAAGVLAVTVEDGTCNISDGGDSSCPSPYHVQLPLQFSGRVNLTAHRVGADQAYPPRERTYRVWYDVPGGRFRAEVSPDARTFIRRFDKGYEAKVVRAGRGVDCWQSRLDGRAMAPPEWPAEAVPAGEAQVGGTRCQRWRHDWEGGAAELCVDGATGAPVQVQVLSREASGELQADMTYRVWDFKAGPPDVKAFKLPQKVKGGLKSCQRQPNDIGFPHLHFWHHYYRA
mmetsp:Transcript_20507/g.52582  ORF Transcript_20507/g.52582 Transcript_20507/m.52582 type:complete len:249 (+) Transcript_20507:187-933(+)